MSSPEETIIEEPSQQPKWRSMAAIPGIKKYDLEPKDLQKMLAEYLLGAEVDKISSGGWQNGVYLASHGETRSQPFYVGTQIEKNSNLCRSILLYGKEVTTSLEGTAVYWGKTPPQLSHVLYFYQRIYKRKQDPEPVKPKEGMKKAAPVKPKYQKKTEAQKAQESKLERGKNFHQGLKL
ncbi:hypothetical protein KCU95_g2014, partial [Aureobasidium melanogenum]